MPTINLTIPVLAITLLVSIISHAATITVSQGGCTLNDAIRSANDDQARGQCSSGSGVDTISFQSGFVTLLDANLPIITSPLTIESVFGGHTHATIDGDGNFRGLDIDGVDVTLNNIRIQNGYRGDFEDGGSAIRLRNGSSVILNNCVITNNLIYGSSHGGAILLLDSDMEMNDSLFYENRTRRALPAVHYKTGGIHAENATVTMNRSEVYSNFGGNERENYFFNTNLIVEDSVFESNRTQTSWYHHVSPLIMMEGSGSATFINSTLLSIAATLIYADGNHDITLRNTTASSVADSSTTGYVNGILDLKGNTNFHVTNSIINTSCQFNDNAFLATDDTNFFLESDCNGVASPGVAALLPLAERGGPTRTMAPHWLSAALNSANNVPCPTFDQRGQQRDSLCDMGAYERSNEVDIAVEVLIGSAAPYPLNHPLVINVNLSNLGQNTANGIQVDLDFSNLTITSLSGLCTANPCIVDSLLPSAECTIRIEAIPNNDMVSNFGVDAQLSNGPGSIYADTNAANDSDALASFRAVSADLSIEKTLMTAAPFSLGQTIQYQLKVENHGPRSAIDIQVSDVPSNLTILSITNCSPNPTGPCEFPVMSDGDVEIMVVSAQITGAVFDNEATVQSVTLDHDTENNSDNKDNGGNTENDASLKVTLTETTSGIRYVDKPLAFTMDIRNGGPDIATNVDIDILPYGFFITGVSGACSVVPCQVASIDTGGATLNFTGFIDTTGAVTIATHAEAQQNDDDISNNTATVEFNSRQAVDMATYLDLMTPPPYIVGQVLQYRLMVRNEGITRNYGNDVLVDISAQRLEVVTVISDSCLTLPCIIPAINVSNSEIIDVMVRVLDAGPFDLVATANAVQYDPYPDNNTDDTGNGGSAVLDPEEVPFSDSME